MKVLLLAALLGTGCLFAQDETPPAVSPDAPKMHFDVLNFSSDQPGMGRLDVYVEVPYEALHFSKEGDLFRTAYDVSIDITDSLNALVTDKFWTEKVETPDYEESISPKLSKLSQKPFTLRAGTYFVAVQVSDQDTKKTVRDKRKVRVRDFSEPFAMSDMMLVNRLATEDEKKVIYPNISGNVADLSGGFQLFFEVYNGIGADSARVLLQVRGEKGEIVESDSSVQAVGPGKKSMFVKVATARLVAGEYTLDAHVAPLGPKLKSAELPAGSTRPFVIRWRGLPVSIVDLDLAIDQMQYVTDKDTIDTMKKAPQEEKRRIFTEYWKKKDPTPGTERNELMEEYYGRVSYANKHFSHYIDGWKTDMGMVYIIFGPPNNVERHPFELDSKPYEIWTYYEQNREFVFVDATGFGDYRLQNPMWDLSRTRPR